MHYTVYKTTCKVNNKFYIGAHKTEKPDDSYLGSGVLFWYAIKKHGIVNFSKEVLADFDNAEDMFALEARLVEAEKENPLCYNLNNGGMGGWEWVEKQNKFNRLLGGKRAYVKLRIWLDSNTDVRRQLALSASLRGQRKWTGSKHKQSSCELMSMLKQGSKNNRFGTNWIFNTKEKKSKAVAKEETALYLTQGWQLGRKLKF